MRLRREALDLMARGRALAAKADNLSDEAKALLEKGFEIAEKILDGVSVGARLGPIDDLNVDSIVGLFGKIMREGIDVPMALTFDLEYSNLPLEKSEFKGGPYNDKRFSLNVFQRSSKVINLKNPDPTSTGPVQYLWNGYYFQFEGEVAVEELK